MKKLLLCLFLVGLSSTAMAACYTQTYIINGKVTICMVCPQYVNCN